MSGRKPWRPYSRYKDEWTSGSLALASDFDADGFNWQSKPTTTRDEAFWRMASTGKSAPTKQREKIAPFAPTPKPEPLVLRTLPPLLPARTTMTAAQYKASPRSMDDFERYLEGVTQRCEALRSTKATVVAVA